MPNRKPEAWSLLGKRVVLAPACSLSVDLLKDMEVRKGQILGFLDRDPVLHGKSIQGVTIYGYDAIPDLNPDVILVASPEEHETNILQIISEYSNKDAHIFVLKQQDNVT
jgi:FlaA1/EpsC-like NDP-sugar epimerase